MISKPDLECNTRGCRLQQQSWQCFSLIVTIQSNLPASPSAHFTCHSCSPVTIYTHLHWNSISRTLRRWFQVKLQVLNLNKYFSFGFLWWNTFIRAKCNNCYSAHSVNSRHLWSCPEISSGLKLQLLTNAFNIKVYHMYGFAYHLKSLKDLQVNTSSLKYKRKSYPVPSQATKVHAHLTDDKRLMWASREE